MVKSDHRKDSLQANQPTFAGDPDSERKELSSKKEKAYGLMVSPPEIRESV